MPSLTVKLDAKPLKQAIEEYRESKLNEHSCTEKYISKAAIMVTEILEQISESRPGEKVWAHEVTSDDVKTYMRKRTAGRQGKPVSNATYNTYRVMLMSFFAYAKEENMIAKNPMNKIPKKDPQDIVEGVSVKAARQKKKHKVNEQQVMSLLANPAVDWRSKAMIAVGWWLGLRSSDIRRLRWANIDLRNNEVIVRITKTGRLYAQPLRRPFVMFIKEYRAWYLKQLERPGTFGGMIDENDFIIPKLKAKRCRGVPVEYTIIPDQGVGEQALINMAHEVFQVLGIDKTGMAVHAFRRGTLNDVKDKLVASGMSPEEAKRIASYMAAHKKIGSIDHYLENPPEYDVYQALAASGVLDGDDGWDGAGAVEEPPALTAAPIDPDEPDNVISIFRRRRESQPA